MKKTKYEQFFAFFQISNGFEKSAKSVSSVLQSIKRQKMDLKDIDGKLDPQMVIDSSELASFVTLSC